MTIRKFLAALLLLALSISLVSCGGPSVKDIAGKYDLINITGEGAEEFFGDDSFGDVESMLAMAKMFGMKFELNLMADKTASMIFATETMTFTWKPCELVDKESGNKIPFDYSAGIITMEYNDVTLTFSRAES